MTSSATQNIDKQSSKRDDSATLLLALAGLIGFYQMLTRVVPFGWGFEMVAIAQNLATHGTYANPYGVLATGPTAANPPLYPFILSICFRIFRSFGLSAFPATAINILANAVTASLLPRMSILFYGNRRPGIVAALLWIFAAPLMPNWDVGLTVLTVLIFCLFTWETMATPPSFSTALGAGLLASALFLFNPSTVFIFGPWTIWLAYQRRDSLRQTLTYCCIAAAVLLLAAGAWGLRNKRQLGAFVIRTNFGSTLSASNNDCARPSLKESEINSCHQAYHPNTNIAEARVVNAIGEIQYDRLRSATAETWIRAHPAAFFRLTIARIWDFWFPVPWDSFAQSIVIWIATVLSAPGLLIMARNRDRCLIFILVVLLIYPAMYYIVISDVRYRLPVLWLSLLPAGNFIAWTWDRRPRKAPAV